ncbi:MAG: hypothetical protein US12_C0013G0016 [Parcubacteria group bacterium GW2011_GWA2_36_24]|nr:MAG: hypothetical protein US12_C0013G0016 [Parcubacteria group bacterium GW2011_GWA2_36_24]
MSKLIVCLGYHLQLDNSIHPVLKNRLADTANLCSKYKDSMLLLMGSSLYGNLKENKISEASAMKEYLEKNFSAELKNTKIITEETTTSTIEQLCYLKEFIKKGKSNLSDIIIVTSEFFSERVKLYAEYVFGTIDGIIFIDSLVPTEIKEKFKKAEEFKLKEGIHWLEGHKKGDDEGILKEQKEFQSEVIKGEIKQPPIS